MFAVTIDVETISEDQYVSSYEVEDGEELWAWVIRCHLDENEKMICEEPGLNSIVIKGSVVYSILEFATNKHILHLDPTDLLVIHDW